MAAPKEATSTELVEVVVARGCTVLDASGKPKKPGETAKIPKTDVASLRALGFIVDPNAKPIPVQQGPKLSASDGPGVTRLA